MIPISYFFPTGKERTRRRFEEVARKETLSGALAIALQEVPIDD
jgi:hypothetical protein